MALLWAENWGTWSASIGLGNAGRYTSFAGTAINDNPFKNGGAYQYQLNVGGNAVQLMSVGSGATRVLGGIWLRLPGTDNWGNGNVSDYIYFRNTADTSAGYLSFKSVNNAVFMAPGKWNTSRNVDSYATTTNLNDGMWHFIEYDMTWDASAGVYKVWVDGNLEINQSGLNNITTGTPQFTHYYMPRSSPGNYNVGLGPFYLANNTSPGIVAASLPLKNVQMLELRATADVTPNQWTPNTGTVHYDRINEASVNNDTSYLEDSTSGHAELFDYADLPTSVSMTILGVVSNISVKQPSGSQSLKQDVKTSTTTTAGSSYTPTTSYALPAQIWNQDATGTNWTVTTVNSSQFGFEVV